MSTKKETTSANAQQTTTGYAKLLQEVKALKDRVSILEDNYKALLNNPPQSVDKEQRDFLKELFSNVHGI